MTGQLLPGPPASGTHLRLSTGQVFTCVGFEPYQRLDGCMVEVPLWATECPSCGVGYTFLSSRIKGGRLWPIRCSACRTTSACHQESTEGAAG